MKLTVKNYKEATKNLDFRKLPEAAREAHRDFDSFAEFYNDDKDIKEMLDNHFKIVEPYLENKSEKHPSGDKTVHTKTMAKKSSPKTHQKQEKHPKKVLARKQAKRKPHEVPLMPLEVKIMRRYLGFDGETVTQHQVSLLYKVIQKAATEKTIRKTSKYAEEIKKIGSDLAHTYKEMKGSCKFEIPKALHDKLRTIVDSYGVTPSVSLIKRFINLYGNITIEKAKRLLTSIKNARKNGKVSGKDSAYERVLQVQKHLEDYLKSDKLSVTQIQLNGLKGVAGLGK